MSLAGVAVLPSAPLLVPGVAADLPPGVGRVCDAVDAVVERLPDPTVAVLVAAGETWTLHGTADADLAGIGRPDIRREGKLAAELLGDLAAALGQPVADGPLPLDLAVLVLLLGEPPPLVALSVPGSAAFDDLQAAGDAVAATLAGIDERAVLVVTGDLSAGLTEASPMHVVEGAEAFDARVVEAVDAGRLDTLAALGPGEARRVGARAWAPLGLAHGACRRCKVGLVRRLYAAPRGVGYLVAYGA